MSLTKSLARRILATSPVIVGAALLALFSFTPAPAMADATLTIYHDFVGNNDVSGNPADPSVNPFNSSHTVVAQYSGVCVAGDGDDGDEGGACLSDADCQPDIFGADDETCDLSGISGVLAGFNITGINPQDTGFSATDVNGQISLTYPDTNGPGTDTIKACADLANDDDFSVADCLTDDTPGDDLPAVNVLTKDWVPTVILTPPGAYNLTGAGNKHTVTATLNGVVGTCNGGIPTACTSDAACVGDGTCDFSGYTLGILVTGGPNLGTTTGLVSTNAQGQVSLTYPDSGGAGNDSIQACADLAKDGDADVSACLADAANNGGDSPFDDIASNLVSKNWSAVNAVLTPLVEFNPIGVQHVLTVTEAGLTGKCTLDAGTACTTNANCAPYKGTCDLSGFPVFFAVVGTCTGGNNGGAICTANSQCNSMVCTGGPNLGDLISGTTNAAGVATTSYTSTVEGVDTIQACVDADPEDVGSLPDDAAFFDCLGGSFSELDVPTNTVTKNWFANFVTGGAGVSVTVDKKKNLQFSGIVGKQGQTGIQGQWNAVSMVSGKTVSCHFDSFTSLVFSGPPATNPASTHNTAMFTTGPGKCNDGSTPILTATMVDYGEGKKVPRDTINVLGDARFTTGGVKNLATGNLQVHSIILP